MDFEIAYRPIPTGAVGMDLDGESARRAGGQPHRDWSPRHDLLLDVVAVQVNGHRPVRRPAQRDLVALLHAHEPCGRDELTATELEFEDTRLGGRHVQKTYRKGGADQDESTTVHAAA